MSETPYSAQLRRYLADVKKGVAGIGLRRQLSPTIWQDTHKALQTGNIEDIALLLRNVGQESLSLLAGKSSSGGRAIQSMALIHAQSIIQLLDQAPGRSTMGPVQAAALIDTYVEHVLAWADVGRCKAPLINSDLDRLGQELFTEASVRAASASAFVASCAVLSSVLTIFTSKGPDASAGRAAPKNGF